jgi:L-lysine exporter family protein LysE/ArgO
MYDAFAAGFWLGLGLIVAIGAQNAFVLRQGLMGRHVFWVALTCALSDAVLIALGVVGLGAIVSDVPSLAQAARWGGAAFLGVYGGQALLRAVRGGARLEVAAAEAAPLGSTLAICLAITWLNPHVYLDTVVLLGSVSAGFGADRGAFGAGAVTASFVFFFTLAYGAAHLRPVFARPAAWRAFDALVAVVMWAIAVRLATG